MWKGLQIFFFTSEIHHLGTKITTVACKYYSVVVVASAHSPRSSLLHFKRSAIMCRLLLQNMSQHFRQFLVTNNFFSLMTPNIVKYTSHIIRISNVAGQLICITCFLLFYVSSAYFLCSLGSKDARSWDNSI